MATISETLALGLKHQESGDYAEAERLYSQALQEEPSNHEALHLMGAVAYQTGKTDTALEYMKQAIAQNSKSAQYHFNIGQVYCSLSKFDLAIPYLAKAAELCPTVMEIQIGLGDAYFLNKNISKAISCYYQALAIKADNQEVQTKLKEAYELQPDLEKAISESIAINPGNFEVHLNLGDSLRQKGNFEAAITSYQRALRLEPDDVRIHDKLAASYLSLGRLDKALEVCNTALEIQPEYAIAHITMGNLLQAQEKFEEAISSYTKALTINPESAEAESNLGAVFHKQGNFEEAINHYQKAIAIKPSLEATQVNLAGLLYQQGKLDEALDYWQKIVETKPELANAQVYIDLGIRRSRQGNLEQAEIFYKKAISLDTKASVAYLNLAGIAQAKGQIETAIGYYQIVVEIQPNADLAYLALGQLLRQVGKDNEALECEYKVLTLKPTAYGAEVHFNVANALAEKGKFEDAARCYQQAITLKPDYVEAFTNMGLVLLHCNQAAEAVTCFREALVINPEVVAAREGLERALTKQEEAGLQVAERGAEVFHFRLATTLQSQGKLDEAIVNYQKALAVKPDFAEAYSNLGITLLRQGKAEEAISKLRRALEIKPNYVNALCNLGIALTEQKKFEEAISTFHRALEIEPEHVDSNYNLAGVLASQKRLEEGIDYLQKVLKLSPNYVPAFLSLGGILAQQEKFEEAQAYFEKALEVSPYSAEVNCAMGSIMSRRKEKIGEAIEYFQTAIDIKPNFTLAYLNLSSALAQIDRIEEAEKCLWKILRIEPKHYDAHCKIGEVLARQGKFELALSYLDSAIKIRPDQVNAYANKIIVLGFQLRIDEAITCLNTALAIKPDSADLYFNYGMALGCLGKFDEAIERYKKVLELDPKYVGAYSNIGVILSVQGKKSKAIEYYQRGLEQKPDSAEIQYRLGVVLIELERFDEAGACLQKSLEIQPDFAEAFWQLISLYNRFNAYEMHRKAAYRYRQLSGKANIIPSSMALMGAYMTSGMNDLAKKTFLEDLEPEIYRSVDTISPQNVGLLYASLLFSMPNVRDDIAKNSKLSKLVGEQYVNKVIKASYSDDDSTNFFEPEAPGSRPLRIGILSPYFRRHSVGWCSADVIKELSTLTPNLFLYGTTAFDPDDRTQIFKESVAKFYQPGKLPSAGKIAGNILNEVSAAVSLSKEASEIPDTSGHTRDLINQIIRDELDVLIELDSVTSPTHAEVLHCKAAPLCLTWLGWDAPYTSEDNYFLCDWYTHPEGTEEFYREKLLRMPGSFMSIANLESHPIDVEEKRAEMNLRPDQVIYLGIVPGRKFNPAVAKAQVEIIKNVPDSVMIHKGSGDLETIKAGYQKECEDQGVDFSRFIFQGTMAPEEAHRTSYLLADVILDPYPCNGGTISLEALFFNLPLVTITGEQFFARMGYSFLKTLGIEEGIAYNWKEYVEWGTKFGLDTDLRLSIKNRLIQSKQPESLSPLWNPKQFAKDMYGIFEKLLQENA